MARAETMRPVTSPRQAQRAGANADAGAVPPGWDYNPSAWAHRVPLAVIALCGFLLASYLALYQVGVFGTVWEPFFGEGSRAVLNSALARYFPIPDAALGAAAYLAEAVCDLAGGEERWRTRPWLVLLFGLIVVVLGVTGVGLAIAQPVFFGAYCTLCLGSAILSVNLVGPALPEILATLQHLRREHDAGRSLWRAFWGLDTAPADGREERA